MKIEVFSAGCSLCDEAIALVNDLACSSCEIELLDMQQEEVVAKAKQYGIQRVPAVAVNGKLAQCCNGNNINAADLRAAGIGNPVAG
jgi:hypothetical protein